jgi:DNA-binding transcriptional MocR family regulator
MRLPADRFSADAVAEFYARLDKLDARVAPGSWFGEQDRVFRLGFGTLAPSEFSAALDRLADALASAVD